MMKTTGSSSLFLALSLGLPPLASSCAPAPETAGGTTVQQSARARSRLTLQDYDGDGRSDVVTW
jgi:hypothetical protein